MDKKLLDEEKQVELSGCEELCKKYDKENKDKIDWEKIEQIITKRTGDIDQLSDLITNYRKIVVWFSKEHPTCFSFDPKFLWKMVFLLIIEEIENGIPQIVIYYLLESLLEEVHYDPKFLGKKKEEEVKNVLDELKNFSKYLKPDCCNLIQQVYHTIYMHFVCRRSFFRHQYDIKQGKFLFIPLYSPLGITRSDFFYFDTL